MERSEDLKRVKDMYPYLPIKKQYIIKKFGHINYLLILIGSYKEKNYKLKHLVIAFLAGAYSLIVAIEIYFKL